MKTKQQAEVAKSQQNEAQGKAKPEGKKKEGVRDGKDVKNGTEVKDSNNVKDIKDVKDVKVKEIESSQDHPKIGAELAAIGAGLAAIGTEEKLVIVDDENSKKVIAGKD